MSKESTYEKIIGSIIDSVQYIKKLTMIKRWQMLILIHIQLSNSDYGIKRLQSCWNSMWRGINIKIRVISGIKGFCSGVVVPF